MLRQVCQLRARFVKGSSEQAALWERQHEVAAEKIYSLCYQLGGFFLKVCFWVFFPYHGRSNQLPMIVIGVKRE